MTAGQLRPGARFTFGPYGSPRRYEVLGHASADGLTALALERLDGAGEERLIVSTDRPVLPI